MKIAVTGKGGSGKSTISGVLARQLAHDGHKVLALDADPNPNLGLTLGLSRQAVNELEPVLNALLASGHTHDDPAPDPEDLVTRFGVEAPDGITLVATGRIERPSASCMCCGSHTTTRRLFGDLSADDRIVVADLEAGLNDLIWAEPGTDDIVVAVTEGSAKSVEIARRACALARQMGVSRVVAVANRSLPTDDLDAIGAAVGEEVLAVPEDPAVERAGELGVAPSDEAPPDSPALLAIRLLGDHLCRSARA